MNQATALFAVTATLLLGAVAEPGLAQDRRIRHLTTYGVEIDSVDIEGNPFLGAPLQALFAYGGCCFHDISNAQVGHAFADVWSPLATGRFDPTTLPPEDSPWPCVGGVGHCSAFSEMWDQMDMTDGQFLDAHVAAQPANLGAWNFNRYGTYWLKPGDTSEFRFRLNSDAGAVTGEGHVLWVNNRLPEPATWGLLMAGFGLLGVSLRRQRGGRPDGLAGGGQ